MLKWYKLGLPLVPAIVVRRIMEYIGKIYIGKKLGFVHLVCRYWSLKLDRCTIIEEASS